MRRKIMKGLYDNEMKLEFTSKTSNEAFARITVAAFAAQLDPTIDELSDIKTAVSEAVTNSIIHGYDDEDGIVKIEAKIFANNIEIVISDRGKGIENVEMAMRPLYTSKPDLERSGMGFTIMESFMDEVKVESAIGFGTKVIMKKKIESKEYDENDTYKLENKIEASNKKIINE
jgi:stage II sporulation protein AB (anti-sigma F factor)